MNKKQRAESVEIIVRLSWDSLESHLPFVNDKDGNFHKRAIVDYLKIMVEALKLW